MKPKNKDRLLIAVCIVAILLVLGGFFGGGVISTIVHDKNAKTPLGWCVWEITTHEDYDETDYTYTYEKPVLPEGETEEVNVYSYIITVYTEERVGLWYCFIQCECNHTLYKTFHMSGEQRTYKDYEVKLIDCDLGYEILVGKDIQYEH